MPPSDEPVRQQHHRAMPPTSASNGGAENPSRSRYSRQDQEDLAAIDRSIERMRQLTPTDPYVLTIPQDEELRYRYTWQIQTRQWLDHTPFDPREDHDSIQYQTFILHDPSHEMYRQHSLRPKEKEEPNGAITGSGAGTPSAAPKKKITLGMYRKKQAGEVVTEDEQAGAEKRKQEQTAKKSAVKSPAERIQADKEILATVPDPEDSRDKAPAMSPKKEKDVKRKREEIDEEQHAIKKTPRDSIQPKKILAEEERPPKKLRQTPPHKSKHPISSRQEKYDVPENPPNREQIQETMDDDRPATNDQGMPPRLSPLQHSAMPARLSPTLPDNIMASLKAHDEASSLSTLSTSNDSQRLLPGKLTPLKRIDDALKRKSPVPRNGFRANSSSPAVRSDTEDRKRLSKHRSIDRKGTPELSQDEEIIVARRNRSKTSSDDEKPSLVVKLKLVSSREPTKEADVLFANHDQPRKSCPKDKAIEPNVTKSTDQRQRDRRDVNSKGVAQKVGPSAKPSDATKAREVKVSSVEKRARPDEIDTPEPQAKRKKAAVDNADADKKKKEPTTPVQADTRSPSVVSSAQKFSTPNMRKDAISASMRRDPSNNSAPTPSALLNSPTANGSSVATKSTSAKGAASQPSNKTPLQQAWETEHLKLDALGRKLKHISTAHLNKADENGADAATERRLAAITAIESQLAWMFAFTAADEARRTADPPARPQLQTWRSLQRYHRFVMGNCIAFPPLQGLASVLGTACNARFLELAPQSSGDTLPRDTLIEVAAGNTGILTAASDGDKYLDMDTLIDLFPQTWKGRAKGKHVSSTEKLSVGSWKGSYTLPIGIQTPVVRAARAGYAILEEWIAQEQLKYEFKLKM